MYIVIVGAGEVGSYVARVLVSEGHEVVVIDTDRELVHRLDGSLNALVIEGSGVNPRTLDQAGIAQADLLLAVTSTDEVNLITCITARKHGKPSMRTVARVRSSWQSVNDPNLGTTDLDLDVLVSAHRAVAAEAINALRYVGTGEVRALADGKVVLVGMALSADSPLVHEPLAEVRREFARDFLVVAVQGRSGVRIPSGSDRLHVDDRAYVLTLPDHTTELAILSGRPFSRVQSVLIVGCGDTGLAMAQDLAQLQMRITIIEVDPIRAEEVAGLLPHATVIHGDGTDPDLLRRRIQDDRIDAVVVLLKHTETATLVGIFAKSLGARKAIVRCDKLGYHDLAYTQGIDAVLSPKRAVINALFRYTRTGSVSSTHLLGDHAAEIIACRVPATPRHPQLLQKPLRELRFPKGVLIGAIVRQGRAFIATGDTILNLGDELLVSCSRDTAADLASWLSG